MHQIDHLPPAVGSIVENYLDLLRRDPTLPLIELYLVGSIALDDFQPKASDIDFVAVAAQPLTAEAEHAIAKVHAAIGSREKPYFDGIYITKNILQRPPIDYAIAPFVVDGQFKAGELCREINPVVWRCLARHGIAVIGTPPTDLNIADDDALLRSYQLGNLHSYWLPWINQCESALAAKAPGADCNAEALAWGVLGVSRIACGLSNNGVVSKSNGGRYGLATYPEYWNPVIREALMGHTGNISRVSIEAVRDALAYMRFVISDVTASRM